MSDLPLDSGSDEAEPEATLDLGDAAANRRIRDRARREAKERTAFWRAVLADKVGRREVWNMIAGSQWGHAFNTAFACGPNGFPQPEATWFAAGAQDLALRLYHDLLRLDVRGIEVMHREHDPRFAPLPKRQKSTTD